jgi:cytochrome c2
MAAQRLFAVCAALLLAGCSELDHLRSTWQPATLADARRVLDGDPQRGRQLVAQHGCTSCHEIPGHRAPSAHVGPPLTRFALRTNIGGSLPNQPGQLVRWVINAPEELPGTGMPALHLEVADARDVAAYLYTLK